MNGPRNTGQEYTGKHRRDSGPGVLPPAWGGRPSADSRAGAGASPMPGPGAAAASGLRSDPGLRSDAG